MSHLTWEKRKRYWPKCHITALRFKGCWQNLFFSIRNWGWDTTQKRSDFRKRRKLIDVKLLHEFKRTSRCTQQFKLLAFILENGSDFSIFLLYFDNYTGYYCFIRRIKCCCSQFTGASENRFYKTSQHLIEPLVHGSNSRPQR